MQARWRLLVALALAPLLAAGCAMYEPASEQARRMALYEKAAANAPKGSAEAGEVLANASKAAPAERTEDLPVGDTNQPAMEQRMLIRDAGLVIGVAKPEDGVRQAQDIAVSLGGYVQVSSLDSAVLRVPGAKFNAALEGLGRLGTVIDRKVEVRDVTEEYTDLEIRLKGKQALLARLEELVKKVDKVDDVLRFEAEISRLTTEIEQFEGKLRLMKSQVTLSRIAVKFDRSTEVVSPKARVQLPFWWITRVGLDHVLGN